MPDDLSATLKTSAFLPEPPFAGTITVAALGEHLARLQAYSDGLDSPTPGDDALAKRRVAANNAVGNYIHHLELAILSSRAASLPDVLAQTAVMNGLLQTLTDCSPDEYVQGSNAKHMLDDFTNSLEGAVRVLANETGRAVADAAGACYVPARLEWWPDAPVLRDGGRETAIDGSGAGA